MEITGLQKTTLLDYPGRIACTVFFSGCNFRCPFCHNASLVTAGQRPQPVMDDEELLAFLETRRRKLDGVCVTGGEPTLQPQLPQLLRRIKDMGFSVKLDTNGSRPEILRQLVRDDLVDYVAMDIKSSPCSYDRLCGTAADMEAIKESAAYLMTHPVDYEFRTTLVKPLHTAEDLAAIGHWLKGPSAYYLQQFVDSGDLIGSGMEAFSAAEMETLRQIVLPFVPHTSLRGI